MKKKLQVVTGKSEVKDLEEIIYGRKASKFKKFSTKEEYKKFLFDLSHVELCEEAMRLGQTPSSEKGVMRNRLLDFYDRYHNPRKLTHPEQKSKNLEDIIKEGK